MHAHASIYTGRWIQPSPSLFLSNWSFSSSMSLFDFSFLSFCFYFFSISFLLWFLHPPFFPSHSLLFSTFPPPLLSIYLLYPFLSSFPPSLHPSTLPLGMTTLPSSSPHPFGHTLEMVYTLAVLEVSRCSCTRPHGDLLWVDRRTLGRQWRVHTQPVPRYAADGLWNGWGAPHSYAHVFSNISESVMEEVWLHMYNQETISYQFC